MNRRKKRTLGPLTLGLVSCLGLIAVAVLIVRPVPAQAETGFFESLRQLFNPGSRNFNKTQPEQIIRKPRPRVRTAPRRHLPALSFAYAHQAGRYKRYRYSHQTPYGFYRHPYMHGLAMTPTPPRRRRRLVRRSRKRDRARRRQIFRFQPTGGNARSF